MHQLSQEISYEAMMTKGFDVLEDLISIRNLRGETGKFLGAWAWGLLAKCRELGCMDSEEVGVLRKLGKKVVYVLRRITAGELEGMEQDVEAEDAVDDEEEDEGEGGRGEDADGDAPATQDTEEAALAAARERALSSLQDTDVVSEKPNTGKPGPLTTVERENMHATLDMIVTIVGECYGQRDLLDGRLLWEEMA